MDTHTLPPDNIGTSAHPPFYSVADLASRWKLTPMTLRRWRKASKLQAHHIGRGIRFSRAEVERIENESIA
jgi:excisionase family DNA binding protein